MLLQPYIENAVKHGLLHKKNNRILSISFSKEDAFLKIVIDDNGIGRKRSEELNKINYSKHASFAMNANKKRIDILQQQFKSINLQIIDKYSDFNEALGTQVIIKLPIQQYLTTNT
jgi:LytS/YehU family sensor histidine kinase